RKVRTIAQHESVARARALMELRRIHLLVVVDGPRIAGLVSSEMLARGAADGIARVEDVMSRNVAVASPDLTVSQAAVLLRGRISGALAVVEQDRLVGIVTVSDLLELLGRGAEPPVATGHRPAPEHRGRNQGRQ